MEKQDKDILTTADTARLLGVSVRTAQLLIEGGSVPSWKTPGGHRRVYRSDIEAIIEGRGHDRPLPSATIVIVAPPERLPVFERLFAEIAECSTEAFDDVHAALFGIGSIRPFAVIVDMADASSERLALLQSLAANPLVGHSRLLAVSPPETIVPSVLPARVGLVKAPAEAAAAIRESLAGSAQMIVPSADQAFPIALNEGQRLVALERSGLLDTPPEEAFDRLTWLAAHSLDIPVSLMTLLTPTRQWFKSRFGLELPETPRSWAFCNHTILQKDVFTVEDLANDPRFADNPAVVGEPRFRFYAGAPVLDSEGFVVGSLCVIDHKPRVLDEREAQTLVALAGLASDEVRLRAVDRQLREMQRSAERQAGNRGSGSATAVRRESR